MNLLSRASLFGQNDGMSKNKKETLGTRMVQTWGTISMANLKTPPLFDQLSCRSEEAYSINEICKFFCYFIIIILSFSFSKKKTKNKCFFEGIYVLFLSVYGKRVVVFFISVCIGFFSGYFYQFYTSNCHPVFNFQHF